MSSPITEISLAGVALDLGDVEYSVQVQHGRNDVTSQPEASSCQITVFGPDGITADMGDSLYVEAYGFARFTGNVSDVTISHLSSNPPTAPTPGEDRPDRGGRTPRPAGRSTTMS